MTTPILRRAVPADTRCLADIGRETFVETFGTLYPPDDLSAYLLAAYDTEATRLSLEDPAQASWLLEDASGRALGYATAGPCGLPHSEAGPGALELKRINRDVLAGERIVSHQQSPVGAHQQPDGVAVLREAPDIVRAALGF